MSASRRPSRSDLGSTRGRRRPFAAAALACALGVLGALGAPAARADDSAQTAAQTAAQAQAEAHLRALYPMGAPSTSTFAGIELAQIAIPNLHLKTRDDRTPERGGIVLGFADDRGQVRAVVRLAVARDNAAARAFVTSVLRGVSGVLAPSSLDEVAFADEGGKGDRFVVATRGNVAYAIDALDGTTPASAIAAIVKKAIAPGTPAFPQAKLTLPPTIDRADPHGARVTMTMPSGATHHVRASGAYVTHGRTGEVVHPFAAGPIEVTATVVDALARVSELRATSIAR